MQGQGQTKTGACICTPRRVLDWKPLQLHQQLWRKFNTIDLDNYIYYRQFFETLAGTDSESQYVLWINLKDLILKQFPNHIPGSKYRSRKLGDFLERHCQLRYIIGVYISSSGRVKEEIADFIRKIQTLSAEANIELE